MPKKLRGIRTRHARDCASVADPNKRCSCKPSWEAAVSVGGNLRRKSFPSQSMAVAQRDAWRLANAQGEVHAKHVLVSVLAGEFKEALEDGMVLNRKREPYRTSTARSYAVLLEKTIIPEFGHYRLDELTAKVIEKHAAAWSKSGTSGSTIRNRLMPLRVIYSDAVRNRDLSASPFDHLRLPKINGPRKRYVGWDEGARMLRLLPDEIARVFAVAIYAGLRAGEIGALTRADIDLDGRIIYVTRSIDFPTQKLGPTKPGRERVVPIFDELLPYLEPAMMVAPRDGFLFSGSTPGRSFPYGSYAKRARALQKKAGLNPISLHVCRHSFASQAASKVRPEHLRDLLGHASIETSMTWYVKNSDRWLEDVREAMSTKPA